MKKIVAIKIILSILSLLAFLHVLILWGIIPYQLVWGGRLNTYEEMLTFETISLMTTVFMIFIFTIKHKNLVKSKTNKFIDILIWCFGVYFGVNTLGNLFSKTGTEMVLGSIISLCLCVFCIIIVNNK